jgi:glutathione S-transferase
MQLYQDPKAVNPRRVRVFLAEKGVSVPLVDVDVLKGEHMQPPLSDLNPMHRVPVLVLDDGTVIAESMAICRYFEVLHPEPCLFGAGALEQAVIEMWNRRIERRLLDPVSQCFRHGHPAMAALEPRQIKEWSVLSKDRAADMLAMLDAEMAARPCIAGAAFSVADITALCAVDFLRAARLELTDAHANLKRWHGEISARPSAAA